MRKLLFIGLLTIMQHAYAYKGYIESIQYDSATADLRQDYLQLTAYLQGGPGGYNYSIFDSTCDARIHNAIRYFIVPTSITLGGKKFPLKWEGNTLGTFGDDWLIIGTTRDGIDNDCKGITSGRDSGEGVVSNAQADITELPPGDYAYSMQYYSGQAFGETAADAIAILQAQGLNGAINSTATKTFNGIAACGEADGANGATIDFGTITSNGQLQPGPTTSLALACNYDISKNDVTYLLKSNNPVAGQPDSGESVEVQLSNGAVVHLGNQGLKQLAPNKIGLDLSPLIDTAGVTPGEGTGSAVLTFTYN
jgi:hypothetical protein